MSDHPITNSTLRRYKPLPKNRKPLPRSKVASGSPPKRRTAPQKRTTVKRWAKLRLPHFKDWVKTQPCCITGLRTGHLTCLPVVGWIRVVVDPAHVRARSLGGPDAANLIPLVRHLHNELDLKLKRRLFEQKYKVDLVALAEATWRRYLTEHPERAA